jgi:hypothetical protein
LARARWIPLRRARRSPRPASPRGRCDLTTDPRAGSEERAPRVGTPGRCLVCGGAIQKGNLVSCARCETQHHRDCFEYAGRCAIYGCGSIRYTIAWHRSASSVPRRGLAPAIARRTPPVRVVSTGGEQHIGIESISLIRNLGVAVAALSGAVAWALSLPAYLLASEFLAVVLFALVEIWPILLLVALVWPVLWFLVPLAFYACGYTIFRCDGSTWIYDPANERLELTGRFLGIRFWRWGWSTRRVRDVLLGPIRGSTVNYLALRFEGGRQLWLADDRSHEKIGYSYDDLIRIGRRLAEAMAVPMQQVPAQPLLPAEPAHPESESR